MSFVGTQGGVLSLCPLPVPRVEYFHFVLCLYPGTLSHFHFLPVPRVENVEVQWDFTDLMKGITMIGRGADCQKKQGSKKKYIYQIYIFIFLPN